MERTIEAGRTEVRPVTTKYHRLWDKKVYEITGGLTILQPVIGYWVDTMDGEKFRERMIPVRIACTEPQIEVIADITAKHYNQRAVMYYRVADQVNVKRYN